MRVKPHDGVRMCFKCLTRHRPSEECATTKTSDEVETMCGKRSKNEGSPPDWKRVVLMVSPQGECHAIGGDSDSPDGQEAHYPGFDYLQERLDKADRYDEDMKKCWHLADTMREDAERFKAERDELLELLPTMRLAEQFVGILTALQQQVQQRHPEGYRVHVPGVPGGIVLSTTTGFPEEKSDDDNDKP